MRAYHSIQQEPTREAERDRAHSRAGLHGTYISLRTLQHNACSDREAKGCGGICSGAYSIDSRIVLILPIVNFYQFILTTIN